MTNSPSGWRQARAILQLPFVVTVVVPACVLLLEGAPRLAPWPGWLLGLPLALAGFALMATTIRFFARSGEGTLAPGIRPADSLSPDRTVTSATR